jgi:hypothetical protein
VSAGRCSVFPAVIGHAGSEKVSGGRPGLIQPERFRQFPVGKKGAYGGCRTTPSDRFRRRPRFGIGYLESADRASVEFDAYLGIRWAVAANAAEFPFAARRRPRDIRLTNHLIYFSSPLRPAVAGQRVRRVGRARARRGRRVDGAFRANAGDDRGARRSGSPFGASRASRARRARTSHRAGGACRTTGTRRARGAGWASSPRASLDSCWASRSTGMANAGKDARLDLLRRGDDVVGRREACSAERYEQREPSDKIPADSEEAAAKHSSCIGRSDVRLKCDTSSCGPSASGAERHVSRCRVSSSPRPTRPAPRDRASPRKLGLPRP